MLSMQRQDGRPTSGTNCAPAVLTDVMGHTPKGSFLCSKQLILLCARHANDAYTAGTSISPDDS
jgi:hypothetical protein